MNFVCCDSSEFLFFYFFGFYFFNSYATELPVFYIVNLTFNWKQVFRNCVNIFSHLCLFVIVCFQPVLGQSLTPNQWICMMQGGGLGEWSLVGLVRSENYRKISQILDLYEIVQLAEHYNFKSVTCTVQKRKL